MLYSQRAWDQNQHSVSGRAESTYSTARSESPSEYSRHRWRDSTASVDEDLIQSRPVSPSPSTRTRDQTRENDDVHDRTVETTHEEDVDPDDTYLATGPTSLQPALSVMGPKTRHVTRAPWEPGGDEDLIEEEDTHEAETRSLFGGRGRTKKPKQEKEKSRAFPASFVPRASSSSRPSVDVSTPTSSSSGGKFRPGMRPESVATFQSNGSDALPFPSPRIDKPAPPSLRSIHRNTMDAHSVSSHPYANPEVVSPHPYESPKSHFSSSPGFPPSSPRISKPISVEHVAHGGSPAPMPVTSPYGLPQKMAPWQYTPSSPTFQLVSLEEAQALKARQRQMSLGGNTNEPPAPRSRAISGPSQKHLHSLERPNSDSMEEGNGVKTLKGRRSLMGLFGRGKEKDRSPRSESPPPLPSMPPFSSTAPSSPAPPSNMSTPTTATPHQQGSVPQLRPQKKAPPPSLNVVVTSPPHQSNEKQEREMAPPPAIPTIQKSATPPPSMPSRRPSKQTSAGTLSPIEGPSHGKPNSAPSSQQGFAGLQLRPMSTMFSSMPADYLANTTPVYPVSNLISPSNSAGFSTQSPTTPSLWSSRSESMSTGSSEIPPITPGGLVHSTSISSSVEGGVNSISLMQKQVYGARDAWKAQIADLEAQVRALKAEVTELKKCPCPSCGYLGGGSSQGENYGVLNRPRAKTALGTHRFGNAD